MYILLTGRSRQTVIVPYGRFAVSAYESDKVNIIFEGETIAVKETIAQVIAILSAARRLSINPDVNQLPEADWHTIAQHVR